MRNALWAAVLCVVSCSGPDKRADPVAQRAAAEPVLVELRAARFREASARAGGVLASDGRNAQAAAARALSRYIEAMHELISSAGDVLERADAQRGFGHA